MATRGTAAIITNEGITFGPEFNGDMAPQALGEKFYKTLEMVENGVDFIKFNNSFNKYNHGYDGIMNRYQGKFEFDKVSEGDKVSMKRIYKEFIATSDWMFLKNISNKSVEVQVLDKNNNEFTVEVEPGETFRVNFGILR